jgi:K(+)-stimulated pyrophosphate-energized sodium pump
LAEQSHCGHQEEAKVQIVEQKIILKDGQAAITLPGTTNNMIVPDNGIEAGLFKFISDNSSIVNDTTWFNFDRLTFETGKNTLVASSQEQLGNIANILKAYPNVKVKIGGYTDNTGNAVANLKLSGDRANTVMGELVKLGIVADRMKAKGYGQEHPVCPANDTEECRQKNRRISMRVTEK